jgi:hypothetical protein
MPDSSEMNREQQPLHPPARPPGVLFHGAGRVAGRHADAFRNHPGAEVAAGSSRRCVETDHPTEDTPHEANTRRPPIDPPPFHHSTPSLKPCPKLP